MFPGLLTFSIAILGDFCSSIAIDIGKKKTLSFLEEQGEPIINHHLARALIRALSGSLIEQLNAWCETPEGKQNKDYVSFAINQLQVISDETTEKNADWTEFLEKFNNTSLTQAVERIRCNQPIQTLDLGKKAIGSLNGFFSDPAQNHKALSNFCDFLYKEDGALFNCNLYERFREEIIEDPVTFNDFTIHFLSQIYTGIENAFPNSEALVDTLSNISVSLGKIDAKVDIVVEKIDTVPEKVVKLLQDSCVPMKNNEQKEQISKMLTHYNPSELPKYPKKLKKFVTENRANELKKALTYLENHRVLLISGVGGVGKSTLARAIIDLRPTTVSDPFWFSFYDNQDAKLGDILEQLASYLNAPEIASFKTEKKEPGKNDVDRLTGELHRRSEVWFIFDDLSMILEDQYFSDKGIELLFSSLGSKTHNAKVIITSRILPILKNGESLLDVDDDEEKHHLSGLKTNFAVDYLASNGLEKVGHQDLEKLATGVDGHPLALKLLVKLVKKHGAANVLSDLSIYQTEKEDTIKKARNLFNKLAGDEKELLERISVYREPVIWEGLKEMFTEKTPKNAIDKLIDKSLLETDNNGNYWLHSLIQEFSYEDLKNKKEAHMVAFDYYKSLDLPENPTRKEDIQRLIEAHYHACIAEEYDQAFNLIFDNNLHEYLDLWGNYAVLVDLYSKLLPKNHFGKKTLLKDKRNSITLGNLGLAYYCLGEPRKAIEYHEQALKISREIGDKEGEGTYLGNMGLAYNHLGDLKKAIGYFEQALKISRKIGDRRVEGDQLGNLGLTYNHLGDPRKAIEYHEQALKISIEIGDRKREGNSLGNLGNVYSILGDLRKAIKYYEQALKISREIGARRGEGNRLGNLGNVCYILGESRKAIEYYEQALKISTEIGNRRGEGIWLFNLGNAYSDLGDLRKAIEYYEQALKISREMGDRRGEGDQLGNLGNAYGNLGEPRKAIEYYEQTLKISREIGDRRGEGTYLGNLGVAYYRIGETRKAIEYYEQALKISREIGDRRNEENWLENLGLAYYRLGETKKAIEYYEQALKIAQEIEDPSIIHSCERNLKELKDSKK